MMRWNLKKCPRCKGDLYLDPETDGWYEQCLQCGYLNSKPINLKALRQSGMEHKKTAQMRS